MEISNATFSAKSISEGKIIPEFFVFFSSSSHVIVQVVDCTSGVWEKLAGMKSASSDKNKDVKSAVQVATCPICVVFWKLLYQSRKRSSRRKKPYLYSNLLHRNPHCQAHKRFIELGRARSYRKLVGRYCHAIKQQMDKKRTRVWMSLWLFCFTGGSTDLVIEYVCTVIGISQSHCSLVQAKVRQPSLLVLI